MQFVGELGRVMRNVGDGRPGAIDMRAAVRFHGQPAWRSVAGRHIFADNIGQVQAQFGFLTSFPINFTELLERIGHAQVEVRRSPTGPASLTEAGLALAERYLVNTALTSQPPGGPPFPPLVRQGAGSPFVVLAEQPGNVPAPSEALPFTGHSRLSGPACSWSGPVGDQMLDIWMLPMHPRPAGTRMAVVRGLCRVVGWLQELAILQRVAGDPGGLVLDPARIEAFTRDRAGKLRRRAFEGWPVEPILARVTQQSAAMDAERAGFAASVRPLLSAEAGNDILASLRRVDLHRDALELEAKRDGEFDPEKFVAAARSLGDRAARAPQRTQGEMPGVVQRVQARADALVWLLPTDEIRRVQAVLVNAGLTRRAPLLAALDTALVARLRESPTPDEQLLLDLMALNGVVPVDGAVPPLADVLRNAAALMQGRDPAKADDLAALAKRAEQVAAGRSGLVR
jgi:hypothetical protein